MHVNLQDYKTRELHMIMYDIVTMFLCLQELVLDLVAVQ